MQSGKDRDAWVEDFVKDSIADFEKECAKEEMQSSEPENIVRGYITCTADLLHIDHLRLLRKCHANCDFLTVGLTVDSRVTSEKGRPPMFSFEHRRALLEACSYVNRVIPHYGESKADAWRRLQFDVLFTTTEYENSDEFKAFERDCPEVRVTYFETGTRITTSELISGLRTRFMSADTSIMSMGINGPLVRTGDLVIKPVKVSRAEHATVRTSDTFSLCPRINHVRNWKRPGITLGVDSHGAPVQYPRVCEPLPNLAGVNQYRELDVQHIIEGQPWCTWVESKLMYTDPSDDKEGSEADVQIGEAVTDLASIQHNRCFNPRHVYWMIQRYGGQTLHSMLANPAELSKASVNELADALHKICADLRALDVVHGDLHSRNILCDSGDVNVVDFGWCTHSSFTMSAAETRQHDENVEQGWDMMHLINSLLADAESCSSVNFDNLAAQLISDRNK